MIDRIRNLSLNGRLALTAFGLGFIALFAGNPYLGTGATVNAKELSLAMAKDVDQVAVTTLADWIIQGKADFRVVDLRPVAAYGAYHIPPAENIPVGGLDHASLQHNEKIVLYADDGTRAAQAWMLLRAKGYNGAYVLRGGLEAWKDSILFPRVPENPTPAQAAGFAKLKEVSKFFGGTPQGSSGDSTASRQGAMPKLAMPTAPASSGIPGAPGAPKKKKKEGC